MEIDGKKIRCKCCGKWVAVERNGELYVWCRRCKKEVKLPKISIPNTDNKN